MQTKNVTAYVLADNEAPEGFSFIDEMTLEEKKALLDYLKEGSHLK